MPPPLPLTAAPTPELDWSRSDTPVATEFGDIYFSTDGGLEETQTVFLKGCGLPERWASAQDHIIGELGFGSGLNLLVAWQAFEKHAAPTQHLHFISIEKFPFTQDMLRQALAHWPTLKDKAERLIALWPGPVKGVHRLHLSPRVTLTLYIEDVETALDQMSIPPNTCCVDSWFLDGFSPAKNPAMWSGEIMQKLAKLSHNQTRLATFTVAGHVRTALSDAGFSVSKETGFGRKRHRLEARFNGGPNRVMPRTPSPLIIGGGIAGASLVRAARRAGLSARLIHDDPDMKFAASGNPAALVKPRLDLQDRPESRFFLAAFLHALRAYQDDGTIISEGVTQIAKDEKEQTRFEKILANAPLPPEQITAHPKGISFPKSVVIDPVKTITVWRQGVETTPAQISQVKHINGQWQALDQHGQVIDSAEILIIASGAGVRTIHFEDGRTIADVLELRFSRGQLSWAKGQVDGPTAYGGYALPLGEDILLGATHDRVDMAEPYELRIKDDQRNLEGAHKYLNKNISLSEQKGRASLRVTTANTLPRITEIAPNLWVFTGLGSRGFSFAPLLADQLVAKLMSGPAAMTPQVWAKLKK